MVKADDDHILFIEPSKPAAKAPVQDELSAKIRELMSRANPSRYHYFGIHHCICGAKSDSQDWFLPTGEKTNSLAVHYVEYHRKEVPQPELDKIRRL